MFFSYKQVLTHGLDLLGIVFRASTRFKTRVAEFKAHYGSPPSVLATVWCDLVTTGIEEARLDDADNCEEGLTRFLIANFFLTHYPKCSRDTAQKFRMYYKDVEGDNIWRWVAKIAALKSEKIFWHESMSDPHGPKFPLTVDGKDQQRWEVKHSKLNKDRRYYSHKFDGCALKWEIGVAVHIPQIVHLAGPFRGGKHDSSIYKGEEDECDKELRLKLGVLEKYESLESKIPDGKFGIADGCYEGGKKLALPCNGDSKELKKFKSRARCRHESVNGRMCKFNAIGHCFRHSIQKQKITFEAVAVLVQYHLDDGSPLFSA